MIFGFEQRFGLYRVDFETQRRIPKLSVSFLSRRDRAQCDRCLNEDDPSTLKPAPDSSHRIRIQMSACEKNRRPRGRHEHSGADTPYECDALVVGSGRRRHVRAVTAGHRGLMVLIVEKDRFGGTPRAPADGSGFRERRCTPMGDRRKRAGSKRRPQLVWPATLIRAFSTIPHWRARRRSGIQSQSAGARGGSPKQGSFSTIRTLGPR